MRYKRTQKDKKKKKSEQCINKKSSLTLLSSIMRCIPELSTLRTKGGRFYPSVLIPYGLSLASQVKIPHTLPSVFMIPEDSLRQIIINIREVMGQEATSKWCSPIRGPVIPMGSWSLPHWLEKEVGLRGCKCPSTSV